MEDNCSLYVAHGGHRYYKDGAWDFILSHLDAAALFNINRAVKDAFVDNK